MSPPPNRTLWRPCTQEKLSSRSKLFWVLGAKAPVLMLSDPAIAMLGESVNRRITRIKGGVVESAANDGTDRRDVRSTGQFGDHATKGAVLIDRGLHHRRENVKVLVHDGGRRLVTARFNAEDQRHYASVGRRLYGSGEIGPENQGVFVGAFVVTLAHPHRCKSKAEVELLRARIRDGDFERGALDAPLFSHAPRLFHQRRGDPFKFVTGQRANGVEPQRCNLS